MAYLHIEIPEELHRQLGAIAAANGCSETCVLVAAVQAYVDSHLPKTPWTLPVVDIGEILLPEDKWAEALEDDRIEHLFGGGRNADPQKREEEPS